MPGRQRVLGHLHVDLVETRVLRLHPGVGHRRRHSLHLHLNRLESLRSGLGRGAIGEHFGGLAHTRQIQDHGIGGVQRARRVHQAAIRVLRGEDGLRARGALHESHGDGNHGERERLALRGYLLVAGIGVAHHNHLMRAHRQGLRQHRVDLRRRRVVEADVDAIHLHEAGCQAVGECGRGHRRRRAEVGSVDAYDLAGGEGGGRGLQHAGERRRHAGDGRQRPRHEVGGGVGGHAGEALRGGQEGVAGKRWRQGVAEGGIQARKRKVAAGVGGGRAALRPGQTDGNAGQPAAGRERNLAGDGCAPRLRQVDGLSADHDGGRARRVAVGGRG